MMQSSHVLISLALGYLVLTQANKEKGLLRLAGLVVGLVVLVTSTAGLLCVGSMCMKKGGCGLGGGYGMRETKSRAKGMGMCPVMGSGSMASNEAPQEKSE